MDGAGSKSGALGSVSEEGLAPGASRMGTSCESIRGWLTGEEFVKVEREFGVPGTDFGRFVVGDGAGFRGGAGEGLTSGMNLGFVTGARLVLTPVGMETGVGAFVTAGTTGRLTGCGLMSETVFPSM